ncbi:MAG: hypothetical protein WCV68_00320 [Candidatus Paceibacterota bacterium]|jgi:hypothetical protein
MGDMFVPFGKRKKKAGTSKRGKAVASKKKPVAKKKVAAPKKPKKKAVPKRMKAPAPRKLDPVSLVPTFCGEEVNLSDPTRIFDLHEILFKQGILSAEEYKILVAALRDKINLVLKNERLGV